ncbi:MAG: amidohydrolase family protein [Caldilineaceae bacterium]
MSSLLIKNAHTILTMDAARREIADGAILVRDREIAWVGSMADLPPQLADSAAQTFDAAHKIVLPGLVNTHHHFYQTLTRVIPAAQNAVLFDWLKTLYPIWAELTPDDVQVSTQLALCELLLSGCTTASDHHYLWPNGARLDDQFAAAESCGRALPRRSRQHELGRKPGRAAAGPRHRK